MHRCKKEINLLTQKHPRRRHSMRGKIYCRCIKQTSRHQATTVIGLNNMAFTRSLEQPDYWKSDNSGIFMVVQMGSVPFVSVKTAMPYFTAKKHWNDSDEYSATTHSHMFHWDRKFPLVRHVSGADCRCCSAAENRTQQWPERDIPAQIYTRVWFSSLGVQESIPDERAQKPSVSSCFAETQKLSGSHLDVRCEFWEVAGSRQRQRPLLTKEGCVNLSIMSLLCQ